MLIERLGDISNSFPVVDSEAERRQSFPPYEHRTVVKPLYGLQRTGREQFQLGEELNQSRPPLKYGGWSKLKVLQVDDTILSTEDVFRLAADKEGTHVELDSMTFK